MDEASKEEAYRIASEEVHDQLEEVIGGDENHEAAFKLLSATLGEILLKGKGKWKESAPPPVPAPASPS